MFELSAPQATVIGAALVILGGLAAYFGRGLAFILQRRLIGAPRHEQAAYLNSLADLLGKLKVNGATMEDVHRLEVVLRNPAFASGPVAAKAVEDMADDADEPHAFHSNYAMKARAGAAYEVADAQLKQALMNLKLLVSEKKAKALDAVQRKWTEYRRLLAISAALEFEGGTHAPLAASMTGLSETERRTNEISAQVKERSAR